MDDSFDIVSSSPTTQQTARFAFGGEIRFGPPYYALSVDGYSFGQRTFGADHLWSPSSRLLAVQEWLTLDYSEGPITALVLIDLQLGREATVARATKGFLVPEAFAGPILKYRADYSGRGVVESGDVDITKIKQWTVLP